MSKAFDLSKPIDCPYCDMREFLLKLNVEEWDATVSWRGKHKKFAWVEFLNFDALSVEEKATIQKTPAAHYLRLMSLIARNNDGVEVGMACEMTHKHNDDDVMNVLVKHSKAGFFEIHIRLSKKDSSE